MDTFVGVLEKRDANYKEYLRKATLRTLQVNMGNLCNQRCLHCHIDGSPEGQNVMPRKVVDDILEFLSRKGGLTLDITGGAPEFGPNFDYLVESARPLVNELIVRSNLTVLFEPGKAHLPDFFKKNKVHLICSLPCYTEENVERQRGRGVFQKSIKALGILNDLGYAKGDGLYLDLAHNPVGSNLPAQQDRLERDYRFNLKRQYGVEFNRLIAITNAPVGRFADHLKGKGEYEKYKQLLIDKFNDDVLECLMCRNSLSVGFDGRLYDCDFNLALGLTLKDEVGKILTLDAIANCDALEGKQIIFGEHCFACCAGSGSSCQGALDVDDVRTNVKYFYREAASQPKKELCCPTGYDGEDISHIPKEVLEVSYGCGSPMSLAKPKQGNVVVDLGCGAGIDCFIAAKKVGVAGKVIGIDMTEEMLDKANRSLERIAGNLRFLNCEFRLGFLEDVPVESESVDLVISNCVVNLSEDKSKVFKEIYRILKDGGRFVISDIVADKEVPKYLRRDEKLWGECISGALTQNEFLTQAKEAGFYGLSILKNFKYREVGGIQFCSMTVEGHKLKKGRECVYIGQYATYIGPYSEVHDDNHSFPRGIPIEVCTDTAKKLKSPPYAGQFILTDVEKDGGATPCCPSEDQSKPCC